MFIVFEGRMGSGKTLSSTVFAVLDWYEADRKIIANYVIDLDQINRDEPIKEVKEGDFTYLTYKDFVEDMNNNKQFYGVTFIIDEAYLHADSRLSQSGYSRLLTYFALQSRKRDVDLYLTSQQFQNLDIRLRWNADIRGICRYNPLTQVCRVRLIDLRSGFKRTVKIYGPEYFPFYDTHEVPPLRPFHIDSVKL